MTLKEYTKETILQLVEAINEINTDLADTDAFVVGSLPDNYSQNPLPIVGVWDNRDKDNHLVANIDFEVATTIADTTTSKIGGGFSVSVLSIGGDNNSTDSNQIVNKVKFSIPIALPICERLRRTDV